MSQEDNKIDLNSMAASQNLYLKLETIKEESSEDACLRRLKDKCLFFVTLLTIPVIIFFCIGFIIEKPDSPYAGIAMNGAIGLVMALAGYYVRGDR